MQRALRLPGADAGFQLAIGGNPGEPAAIILEAVRVRSYLRLHHDRDEHLRRLSQLEPIESGLRNTDDGHIVAVQHNGSAYDGGVCVEVVPPEAVAEHHNRLAVGNIVVIGSDGAAQSRSNPKDREIRSRNQFRHACAARSPYPTVTVAGKRQNMLEKTSFRSRRSSNIGHETRSVP